MIPVYCATCGIQIGIQKDIVYGQEGYEHIDYGEVQPNEDYGGEYEGHHYCDECYSRAASKEDAEAV
jgi:hypothetical protein